MKKSIFGGGYLLSSSASAELKAAELKAEEEAIFFELNEEERRTIDGMDTDEII